ncbi:MAG: TonB family protein [Gammaproteobacteria bacterium]
MSDESNIEGMAFGNILIGGIIGGGVDLATGAAYEYPQVISHPLICLSEKEKESEIEYLQRQIDDLRRGGSNEKKEEPIKSNTNTKDSNGINVQIRVPKKSKPKLINSPKIEFPLPQNRDLITSVVVVFDVDKKGNVFNSSIYESSGNKSIDNLALEFVRGSTYLPSREDGKTVMYRGMKKKFKISR